MQPVHCLVCNTLYRHIFSYSVFETVYRQLAEGITINNDLAGFGNFF